MAWISEFLTGAGLSKLYEKFLKENIDTKEVLESLSDEDYSKLQITIGEKFLIKKHLAQSIPAKKSVCEEKPSEVGVRKNYRCRKCCHEKIRGVPHICPPFHEHSIADCPTNNTAAHKKEIKERKER